MKQRGKHSFMILSHIPPTLSLAPFNAGELGWAQVYRSPSWNSINVVCLFPAGYDDVKMVNFAKNLGTLCTWRRNTGTLLNPLTNSAIFYFTSVSPLLISYFYQPRSEREKNLITIIPTDSIKKLSCKNCLL